MKVTFKPRNPLQPNVKRYLDRFGHLPSTEAMKFLTSENLDSIAKKALEENQPVPEWRDRETTKTGTRLDDLYGL